MASLAESTTASKRRALGRSLADILSAAPACDLARALRAKFERARNPLLTFAAWCHAIERQDSTVASRDWRAALLAATSDDYGARFRSTISASVFLLSPTSRPQPIAPALGDEGENHPG